MAPAHRPHARNRISTPNRFPRKRNAPSVYSDGAFLFSACLPSCVALITPFSYRIETRSSVSAPPTAQSRLTGKNSQRDNKTRLTRMSEAGLLFSLWHLPIRQHHRPPVVTVVVGVVVRPLGDVVVGVVVVALRGVVVAAPLGALVALAPPPSWTTKYAAK